MNFENIKEKVSKALSQFLKSDTESRRPDDQQHVMTKEERIDEACKESFPASDPPAHSSFTGEIKPRH